MISYFDADAPEQVSAGQLKTVEGMSYYDVWTSFASAKANPDAEAVNATVGEGGKPDAIAISQHRIRTEIKPPTEIDAEARLQMEVRQGGQRAVLFELSRALQIKKVEADGHPIEFIHNPATEGTQLARHANDLVAVVFPQPLRTGQRLELRFVYGGEVLSEAGAGLLYVGARGMWYPNRGLVMSNFDLEFRYPAGWTLVATGQRTDTKSSPNPDDQGGGGTPPAGEQVSRWVSERPIPIAGFNLGKYERVVAHAGDVTVETYATSGVERGFPTPGMKSVIPDPIVPGRHTPGPVDGRAARAFACAKCANSSSRFRACHRISLTTLRSLPLCRSEGGPNAGWVESRLAGADLSLQYLFPHGRRKITAALDARSIRRSSAR